MIFTLFDVIFSIALALIFARGLGFIFDKFKQPVVIGEIIAGLILGVFAVSIFNGQQYNFFNYIVSIPLLSYDTPEFELFAQLGILFLLFISAVRYWLY